jgi:DedD protein
MDHELKQRLIGAVVVTALAAIFIPMLFDDPVDTSGKTVTELTIPQAPADATPEAAQNLPATKDQVLDRPELELNATEINEDNQANASGEAPVTDVPDGEQPGVADAMNGSGSDITENEPVDDAIPKQAGQTEKKGLDTGYVPGVTQSGDSQENTGKVAQPLKEPEQKAVVTTKKSVSKQVIPKKSEVKSVISTEKTKAAPKTQKDSAKKSSAKLVRYSIQAGSFSKKENAQILVDKLRKQGMPASISTKGNFFRVKIGPSLSKDKAKEMKAKLDKQNIKGLLVSE